MIGHFVLNYTDSTSGDPRSMNETYDPGNEKALECRTGSVDASESDARRMDYTVESLNRRRPF
jgi:hypothetical protein